MSEMERRDDERRQSPRASAPDEPSRDVKGDVKRDEMEQMRSNPEVMGRSEPKEMPGRRGGPSDRPSHDGDHDRGMDFWPEMHEYKLRMTDIQSEFIEEPRAAVKKAEQLIEEAVDYMAKAMHENVNRLHKDVEGGADTEKLRLIMRNFSQLIERLDVRRAA